jgi:putative nucleotidyltransferase with HDIG domain
MDAQTFLKGLDNIPDLPTLPNIVLKVNNLLKDQNSSIKELGKTIETDQAMVTKILRLVNSTFYGFRSKIRNIPHAIIILGFNNVRNALVSVSIIKSFSEKKGFEGFEMKDFWKHSIAVAVISKYLSEETKLDAPDDCFVAGLLHDIGKVVLSQYFTELFGLVWKSIQEDGLSFYEAEKELLPANHVQIGAYLAKKWKFPASLIESMTYHHDIRKTVSNLDQLVIVHTANIIMNNYEADSNTSPDSSAIDPEAKRIMVRPLETLSEWFPDIVTEIESACEFFLQEE